MRSRAARHGVAGPVEAVRVDVEWRAGRNPRPFRLMLPAPRFFLMRRTRLGPLVPARLWWCDHDPADPENKLDRGRLSVYPRADIAGVEVEPELLLDRLISLADPRPANPITHWRFTQPITESEYHFRFERLRWAERNAPHEPTLRPKAAVDPRQVELPSFERENAL